MMIYPSHCCLKQSQNKVYQCNCSFRHCPPGIPNKLYFLPPDGFKECKQEVEEAYLDFCRQFTSNLQCCLDETYEEYLEFICKSQGWDQPRSTEDATKLYMDIVKILNLV